MLISGYNQTTDMLGPRIKVIDHSGSSGFFVNSPAGEYGVLYATSSVVTGVTENLEGETLGDATNNACCWSLSFTKPVLRYLVGLYLKKLVMAEYWTNTVDTRRTCYGRT